jgi:ABC-2 type transport system permease protein
MFLYFAYFLFFFWVVYPKLDVNEHGNVVALITVGVIFATVIAMLAIILGSVIKNQALYMGIMAFTTYPFFMTSGYSWPVFAMLTPIQWLSEIVPTTHFLKAGTRIVIMGGSWRDIMPDLYNLLLLLGVYSLLATWRLYIIKKSISVDNDFVTTQ